jgi:peptide/nickel transport system permease protein
MEPLSTIAIWGEVLVRFLPVWIGIAIVFALSIYFKRYLSLYGRLFDSPVGMIGFGIILFWVLTAFMAAQIAPFSPLDQVLSMKNAGPGEIESETMVAYLFGGDNLGRDVFSRMVWGSQTVLAIAPFATLFAFMVGVTLGLPAGYFGGRLDTILSFIANLVLAFPVILLFFLLVTPEIARETIIPTLLAATLFAFPLVFFTVLIYSKYRTRPNKMWWILGVGLAFGLWAYSGLAFNRDPLGLFGMDPNRLNIFVSVVFVNSPTVFRIVRGLTMDIKTRDYIAAAQTRGEGPWYIMLWEVLPNARGPLIVDFCLRVGYTTILLGTLGFFGLGVSPESADWGFTINDGRRLLLVTVYPALAPALALMSLVLGLNLLADGLREQSMRD